MTSEQAPHYFCPIFEMTRAFFAEQLGTAGLLSLEGHLQVARVTWQPKIQVIVNTWPDEVV
jgi:hypothetical protein